MKHKPRSKIPQTVYEFEYCPGQAARLIYDTVIVLFIYCTLSCFIFSSTYHVGYRLKGLLYQ